MYIRIFEDCPKCNGDKHTGDGLNCPKCNGSGKIKTNKSAFIRKSDILSHTDIMRIQGKIEKLG